VILRFDSGLAGAGRSFGLQCSNHFSREDRNAFLGGKTLSILTEPEPRHDQMFRWNDEDVLAEIAVCEE
jgi:hypothetical protein